MSTDEPLIWTAKGNLPLSSLRYETAWDITDEYIKFVERHIDADGDVVRESAHVFSKMGVTAQGEAAVF